MNTTSGHLVQWNGNDCKIVPTEVNLDASQRAGVWLVDGGSTSDGHPFHMVVGIKTQEDAARTYAKYRKDNGHALPDVFRVFPLANLEPISLAGIVDRDGDEEWSAFSDAWVEIRL